MNKQSKETNSRLPPTFQGANKNTISGRSNGVTQRKALISKTCDLCGGQGVVLNCFTKYVTSYSVYMWWNFFPLTHGPK